MHVGRDALWCADVCMRDCRCYAMGFCVESITTITQTKKVLDRR